MRLGTFSTIAAAAVAAIAITACKPRPAAPPAKPATPLSFAQTTPDATVRLTLAPAIAAWPQLHDKLYQEGVAELRKDLDNARNDRAHIAGEGLPNPAYEHELAWSLSAKTPRLVSLKGTWMSYTGGAHPNSGFHTLLWDTNLGEEIRRTELFRPQGPADAGVQAALCEAVGKARAAKGQDADLDPQMWPCPKWRESDLALVASTTPSKFGGVDFVFDPYAIGPYSDGPYEVILPYAAIKDVLAPAYAGEFAGGPAPAAPPRPAAGHG